MHPAPTGAPEPTPASLRSVLKIVADVAGIDGDVRPFLIELAVDFYPRKPTNPVESLLIREQIVGLLQRHHWASSSRLLETNPGIPRKSDPRQVYSGASKSQTRSLFAGQNPEIVSDSDFQDMTARRQIIDALPGNDLYLNSTLYRGERNAPLRTNVQHKIADQRDENKTTLVSLSDEERRGRAEVTLTSLETLEAFGLRKIEDLTGYSFRKMT